MKKKYKGFWIEEISFNVAPHFLIYPIGSKRPDDYLGPKTLTLEDAKILIDSGYFNAK